MGELGASHISGSHPLVSIPTKSIGLSALNSRVSSSTEQHKAGRPHASAQQGSFGTHGASDEKDNGDIIVRNEDVRDMTVEDRATAIRLAIQADPGIPVKSLGFIKFQLMILAICLSGIDSGEIILSP